MAKKKGKGGQKPQKKFSLREYLQTKMRNLPLGKCYISPNDINFSELTVFVTREHPAGTVTLAIYLVDKYCCGVKDATLYFSIDRDKLIELLAHANRRLGLQEVTYTEAHNLVYGALEYAEEIGIPPHRDFDDAQYVLAKDTDDIPLIEYEFGYEGKPYLICQTQRELDYYQRMMLKVLKPEEFNTMVKLDPFGDSAYESSKEDNDHKDADEDESEDLTYEVVEKEEAGLRNESGDKIPLSAFGDLAKNISGEIKQLDDQRKVAYFTLMLGVAKDIKREYEVMADFVRVTESSLQRYREYGDVAFGEATKLLYDAVEQIYNKLQSDECCNYSGPEVGPMMDLCMLYPTALHKINFLQSSYLQEVMGTADNGTPLLLKEGSLWLEDLISNAFETYGHDDLTDEEYCQTFRVSGLSNILDHWKNGAVRSHVHKVKFGFVSKDPANYYKRKVRETIETEFTSDEDFMGLVFVLNNMALSTINFIRQGHLEQAYYTLSYILAETLWTVCSGIYDQWIQAPGAVRECFRDMLSNTVTIFAHMIDYGLCERAMVGYDYRNSQRLEIALRDKHAGLIDLHPVIYAIERTLPQIP